MAHQREFESHEFIPPSNLGNSAVVIELPADAILVGYEGVDQTDKVAYFIPNSDSRPAHTIHLSIEEARKIALVREALRKSTLA